MGIWPFRRREKRGRKLADDGTTSSAPEELPPPPKAATAPVDTPNSTPLNRRDSKRRKRDYPLNNNGNVVDRDAAVVSPPPRHHDGPTFASNSQTNIPNPSLRQPLSTPTFAQRGTPPPHIDPNLSHTSLPGDQYVEPTLRIKKNKKNEQNVLRRKSDKRKRTEHTREQEIKKMVASRWPSGAYGSRSYTHPSPLDNPDSNSFKVSSFRALAPRPLLRYKDIAQYPPTRSVSRTSTNKGKHPVISETHFVGEDRIDELADDMDAGLLRQLLERDNRRSMKSHGAKELVNKKLRHEGVREGGTTPSPPKPDWPLSPSNYSGSWLEDASKEHLASNKRFSGESHTQRSPEPDSGRVSVSDERARPVGNKGVIYGPSSQSRPDATHALNGSNDAKRSSATQFPRSIAGVFRRASSHLKRQPSQQQPSGFSVPSRESITRAQQQQQQQNVDRTPVVPEKSILRTTASGPGSHGTSKFTEHLNDFPMPPSTISPSTVVPYNVGGAGHDASSASRRASACTGAGTIDRYSMSATSTRDGRTTGANSPEPRPDSLLLTRSLASIDSEGSWLAGRAPRRLSQPPQTSSRQALRSTHSASERLDESTESGEGEGNTSTSEEGVFGNLQLTEEEEEKQSPQRQLSDQSTRTVRDASDSGDGTNNHSSAGGQEPYTLHSGVERRPQVVNPVATKKSTEGLLTHYQDSPGVSNPDSPVDVDTEIHRATSIDLGRGHARQISAGSARLLDVPPPSSRRPSASEAKTPGPD